LSPPQLRTCRSTWCARSAAQATSATRRVLNGCQVTNATKATNAGICTGQAIPASFLTYLTCRATQMKTVWTGWQCEFHCHRLWTGFVSRWVLTLKLWTLVIPSSLAVRTVLCFPCSYHVISSVHSLLVPSSYHDCFPGVRSLPVS